MKTSLELIAKLKQLDGAIPYDGECSCQVLFQLANGKTLRIGITDEDIAPKAGIWCDQYPGLFQEFLNEAMLDRLNKKKLSFDEWLRQSSFVEPDAGTKIWLADCWKAAQENAPSPKAPGA